jgi:hypothetical protein
MANQFGPDPPFDTLYDTFRMCLQPGKSSSDCDKIVGSLEAGSGFCGPNSGYAKTSYCACVNNLIPCPTQTAAACANSAFAYRPTSMLPGGVAYEECKDRSLCVNLNEVGGKDNIVSGVTLSCGPVQKFGNTIQASPILAIIAFILLIALIVLFYTDTGTTNALSARLSELEQAGRRR